MTAVARPAGHSATSRGLGHGPASRVGRPLLLGAGLAGLVAARWAATVEGSVGALAVGLAFGAGLIALALAGGGPIGRPRAAGLSFPRSLATGAIAGAALVGVGIAGRLTWADAGSGPALGPGAWFTGGFGPWAAITVLVATAEELVLRGALFGAIWRASGVTAAVVATSAAFALIHVPLYGWHVVPLDLGVGLFLGGLRLMSGGLTAPAAAHALADLATWWL